MATILASCSLARAQPASQARARAEQELLRNQLVSLGPDYADAGHAIAEFNLNNASFDAGHPWHVTIPVREAIGLWRGIQLKIQPKLHDYSANEDIPEMALKTRVVTTGSERAYTISNEPAGKPGPMSFGVPTYGVTFTLRVPACSFDARVATCYPDTTVSVPRSFGVSLTLDQPGHATHTIAPGQQLRFDRSLGPVDVTMSQVEGFTFSPLKVSLQLNQGPETEVAPDISHEARFGTYRKLAGIAAAIELKARETSDRDQGVELKTLITQARIISANAIAQKYADVAKELLVSRADDLARADLNVLALRKLAFAGAALSLEDIDLTIARVDELLADAAVGGRDTLLTIRQELVRARNAIGTTGGAIHLVEGNLASSIDAQIADYQTLLLEYAQYSDDAALATVVPAPTRAVVANGFGPGDVSIPDGALGGRGRAIRLAAGLPTP